MKFSKLKQKWYFDLKAGNELPQLKRGDKVWIKYSEKSKDWIKATIQRKIRNRQYEAEDEDGQIWIRNRKLIHKP